MYIVTKDNPYYPSVKYFRTLEEAKAQAAEWMQEMHCLEGHNTCTVAVSVVVDECIATFNSAY